MPTGDRGEGGAETQVEDLLREAGQLEDADQARRNEKLEEASGLVDSVGSPAQRHELHFRLGELWSDDAQPRRALRAFKAARTAAIETGVGDLVEVTTFRVQTERMTLRWIIEFFVFALLAALAVVAILLGASAVILGVVAAAFVVTALVEVAYWLLQIRKAQSLPG